MQFRQHQRIVPVCLHPITGLHRDQRRCNHNALMPQLDQLSVKAISAWASLMAEMKPRAI